jgi:hypothetical protein
MLGSHNRCTVRIHTHVRYSSRYAYFSRDYGDIFNALSQTPMLYELRTKDSAPALLRKILFSR